MQRARVLLLPVNDTPNVMGFLPAKVFEYLGVQRPILAVAPLGADIGKVLGDGHWLVQRGEMGPIHTTVQQLFDRDRTAATPAKRFERRELTGTLARLLDRIVAKDVTVMHRA
jgi:hypothetical protein